MSHAVAEAPEVSYVGINRIKVVDGFNPRGPVTKKSVADLAKSVKQEGILQPILIRPNENGYKLVAGERRYTAAKIAGVTEIPCLIREMTDEEARAAAFDENEQREDMTAMARALALNEQYKSLGTFKLVAEKRSMQPQQVAALVKMCDLPASIQKIALANPDFHSDLAKSLINVAETPGGESVAVFLANQAMERRDLYRRVRDDVPGLLDEMIRYRTDAKSKKERDSIPYVAKLGRLEPQDVFDKKKAAALIERGLAAVKPFEEWEAERTTGLRAVRNNQYSTGEPGVTVSMTTESFDRVRAAKSAFIFENERERVTVHIFDEDVIKAEVEQIIEAAGRIAEAEVKERKDAARKKAEEAGVKTPEGEDPVKVQRATEREKAKKEAAKARAENEAIGAALLKRGSRPLPKKDQLETIRLMAKVTVRQSDHLAAAGMRLCFTAWKTSEFKELKSKVKREKVTCLEPNEAQARLIQAIDDAKTVDEILRIITDAMIAATYSNEAELPKSKRVYKDSRTPVRNVLRDDMELIDRLAKRMLPEAVEKSRQKSINAG
ncbi:MAG: ParB/RepB/Spo0J family partition protein [Solirubrobacterales bacterium]|nr:ParB/RepB/Spo0J family partition protein [Solirubrobacterales bacterium]